MKFLRSIPAVLTLVLCLCGCAVPSGDDLLQAPQPSKTYQTLQTELSAILASGASYAAPVSGSNRSTVQLIDLDNDGTDEVVCFFQTGSAEEPFTAYIYKKSNDDDYLLTGTVAGVGTAVQSVEYPVVSASGRRGMVVSWKLAGENTGTALSACIFDNRCRPTTVLETEYTSMQLADLTGDGAQNLLLLASDAAGKRVARLFRFTDDGVETLGAAATGTEAVSVVRMTSGKADSESGPQAAVFAEEKTENGVGLTTDIFVYVDDTLRNLALDSEDATLSGTYRPLSVYVTDINGDGVTDLPRAVLMAGYSDAASSDAIYMIDWYTYSVSAAPQRVKTTYQNVAEGWMLSIDDDWHDHITAVKSTENSLSSVQFLQYVDQDTSIPLFTVSCATGSLRDYYAGRDDLIQLGETSTAVFFARIADRADDSSFTIDEQGVKDRFSLVSQAWS